MDLLLFLDTGALTAAATQVVKFCTANTASLVDLDRVDVGRKQREYTLNAYTVRNFPYGKRLGKSTSLTFDYITLEGLDTLLATFNDLIINGYVVTGFKLRKFFLPGQLLMYKC